MRYLLIHGSWHGAWAFSKLVPYLKDKGHEVKASDLPGSGDDAERAAYITYDLLYHHIVDMITASPEPLIIVAQSSAGMLVAQAAEACHRYIHHVFYIASWLPQEGMSLVDRAVYYDNSQFPSTFIDIGDARLRAIDTEKAKAFLYHDCSVEDQEWAAQRLRPKAAQPDLQKMPALDPINTIKRSSYILCEDDRVVNPFSQRDMAESFGFKPSQIMSMRAGHSPFLSKPQELAQMLSL